MSAMLQMLLGQLGVTPETVKDLVDKANVFLETNKVAHAQINELCAMAMREEMVKTLLVRFALNHKNNLPVNDELTILIGEIIKVYFHGPVDTHPLEG